MYIHEDEIKNDSDSDFTHAYHVAFSRLEQSYLHVQGFGRYDYSLPLKLIHC